VLPYFSKLEFRMTSRREHLDALAVGLLLACCLFWGFQQVLVKATLPEVPPLWQAAVRFAGATALLWLWCHYRGIALFERDGSLWPGVLAGVLFCGEFVCIYLGLQHTSASRLTVFLYTAPFWVAGVLPLFVASERLRLQQWLGLALAFVAVVYAVQDGGGASHASPWWWLGDALALLAGALWGLTTVLIRSTGLVRIRAEKLLYYQVALSAFVLPIVSVQMGEVWSFDLSTFAWVSIALQTVIGAFLSYLTWMWLLGHYPATKLSVFVFLTPVFALLFGTVWLNESVTAGLIAALVGVTAGIVLVNKKPAPNT
jgi:drug/metabolite transporter (DMT)-like permease